MRQTQNDEREKDKEGAMQKKKAKINTAFPSHRAPHHPPPSPQSQPLY